LRTLQGYRALRKLSPELKRRSRSLLRLTRISLFLAVGLLCAFVGIVDLFSARLLEDRLLGVLLLTSGVLMIGSAVVLLKRPAWLLTLLAELSGIIFVGSGLAVIFLALAVDSALHRSEGKRQSQPSDRLNAILCLIGALVAALLALGGSWFTSRYLPSQQRPVLNIRATFGDQAKEKGMTTIPLTIRVKNAASHPVRILLAYYEVHGLPVTSAEDDQPSIEDMVEPFKEQIWPGPVQRYSRYTSNVPVTLVQYARILPDATLLAPNEEATMEVLAAFPTGKFKAAPSHHRFRGCPR
jgi:hypothetical protein